MNATIRNVGLVVVVLFVGLAAQLTYLQLLRGSELADDPRNPRTFLRDIARERGPIITADGDIVASSIPADDPFEWQRQYALGDPPGTLFAHLGGYQSIVFGNSGTEREYNDELVGRDPEVAVAGAEDVLRGDNPTGRIVLNVTVEGQQAARDALGGRRGTVVVLEPATGDIVVAYSEPTYDPNPLAGHDLDKVRDYQAFMLALPDNPELARAWRERYPPGSTFKVVTTAIALDAAIVSPERVFPRLRELELPQTSETLENFGGNECGGTLAESFEVSCNTTFGQIGLELGETLADGLERFGINTKPPPADLDPDVVRSLGPRTGSFQLEQPLFAQAAIGQGEVAVTPLEMAMVAAAVANDGVMMVPHAAAEIQTADGEPVRRIEPDEWRRSMTPPTAVALTQMMIAVVNSGTGQRAQIPGIQVAGKTGTAQASGGPHAWFIGFAPAAAPRYAIAVLVEGGGDLGSEATGGRVAAPIAAHVLQTLLTP